MSRFVAGAEPKKLREIYSPSSSWAMTEADQENAATAAGYYSYQPERPSHGKARNQLYFDWHITAVTVAVAQQDGCWRTNNVRSQTNGSHGFHGAHLDSATTEARRARRRAGRNAAFRLPKRPPGDTGRVNSWPA